MDKPRYAKSTCCVPGCTRWSRLFPGEWLCRDHWKALPRKHRLAFGRAQRYVARHWNSADCERQVQMNSRLDRLWSVLKAAAIKAAAGL